MVEKMIVNDALRDFEYCFIKYASIISQTEDTSLRQTFIQIRNNCEASQMELLQLAKEKKYYSQPNQVQDCQIKELKNFLNSSK